MDLLEFAIKMEAEGEEYYREQAKKYGGDSIGSVFVMLANEEADHARILREKVGGKSYRSDEGKRIHAKNVFDGMTDFKMEIKAVPDQLDAYRMALEKEKQSIELYQKMSKELGDDDGLFAFLIGQEQEHYRIIEAIVEMVERPAEWVESAEFGRRKEY